MLTNLVINTLLIQKKKKNIFCGFILTLHLLFIAKI
jgi:hypothetical protein